jgi:hypothetical protein
MLRKTGGFLRRSGAGRAAKTREKGVPGDAYTAATKLLNFAAALLTPFRIVRIVTNLQQGDSRFLRVICGPRGWVPVHWIERPPNPAGITPPLICQRLEQALRFFPYLRMCQN